MPRQLLLDGDDITALMERVRTEVGLDAVVVKAERVRSGGVAGFFAKERFELTVEVPDPPSEPAVTVPVPGADAPRGIDALLDAADAADRDAAQPDAADRDAADLHAPLLPPTPATAHGTPAAPSTPGVPAADTADGARFAALLASFGVDGVDVAALTAADGAAPGVPRQHPAARFTAPGTQVTAATFAPLPSVESDVFAGDAPSVPDAAPAPGAALPIASAPFEPAPALVPTEPAESAPFEPAPAPVAPEPAADTPTTGGATRRAVLGLGVPESLVGSGPLDEPLPLSRLLAGLPRPPAPLRAPGTVVAVVGEGADALAVATQLAHRLRVDPRDVERAGALPPVAVPDAATASAAIPRVRVVAVGVGPDEEDWSTAGRLVAEIAPDQCWAAVDARLKTSDLRAWMRAVGRGRAFDAVAATRVQDTREPGTVLSLDAPVGWLEGLPATPVVWAAVLSERLGADARWD